MVSTLLVGLLAHAVLQAPLLPVAGRVIGHSGQASREHPSAPREALQVGSVVYEGDTVRTGADGKLRLLLHDSSALDLANNTSLVVQTAQNSQGRPMTRIRTLLGRLWARVMPRQHGDADFVIEGPNAVAGVRGTSFMVEVQGNGQTGVITASGSVNVSDGKGQNTLLNPLQQLQATGKGPFGVSQITPGQLEALRGELMLHGSLAIGSAQQRAQGASDWRSDHGTQSHGFTLREGLDRGLPSTYVMAQPTLSLDPGARPTHVRLHININP